MLNTATSVSTKAPSSRRSAPARSGSEPFYSNGVPVVATPQCPRGEALETAAHLVLDCSDLGQ